MISLVKKTFRGFNYCFNKCVFTFNRVTILNNWKVNGKIFIRNSGKIEIGENFMVNSGNRFNPIGGDIITRLVTQPNSLLSIGNHVGISNSSIFCAERIEIRDYVYIGGGCKIWDTDFHSIHPNERLHYGDRNINTAPILIDVNAFVGANTIILKGVKIGKNAVIGAGSIVTKDIPHNEIWAGNPAKFIKKIIL